MQSKWRYRVLSFVLSIAFVVCTCFAPQTIPTASAASVSELENKKDRIEQEIKDAQAKIDQLAAKKEKTEEYIRAIDKKIQLLQDQIDAVQEDCDYIQSNIDEVQAKIEKTENEIDKTEKKIKKNQKEFDTTFDEYCQRLRAIYISGNATNLEVLMTSTDISSMLTRSEMIKSVSKKDSEILDSLMKKMDEIKKSEADLKVKKKELKKDKQVLVEKKEKLQANLDKIQSAKWELDEKVSEANELIAELNSATSEYQEAIEEDQNLIDEVNSQIREAYAAAERERNQGSSNYEYVQGTGQLAYPTAYRSISAGFPNYSSGRYHGGIDFPCPTGTEVHAADSGTVIAAVPLWYSYGHYIIIDHNNGLSTLYAHNSQLLVSQGQSVSKGQLIAYSGNTGNSTGPHCHFEVRANGTQVNPLNYL